MNSLEKRASLSLASIFGLRMLGLFMVLPVFSLYATTLHMARPSLIGLALGIYGLTQALCQIPFGMLSDRFGRRQMITLGLIIFILGSLFAAVSHNIYGVIVGRALQGAGAIGGAVNAFLADLTQEENRMKAMAIIGSLVGLTFMVAMVAGPILNTFVGVSGIFALSAILGGVAIFILYTFVPKPHRLSFHRDAETLPALLGNILKDVRIVKLIMGALISHAILTASFVALPISLQESALLPEAKQGYIYVPVLALAFLSMVPMIITAEKRRKIKRMMIIAIAMLSLSEFSMWLFHTSLAGLSIGLFIFFTAFSFLEACLPSIVSKQAPATGKGSAMGLYSTSQYLGMFLGGVLGGLLYAHHHINSIYLAAGCISLIWFIFSLNMQEPRYLTSFLVKTKNLDSTEQAELENSLNHTTGIAEATFVAEEQVVYFKYDKLFISEEQIMQLMQSYRLTQ